MAFKVVLLDVEETCDHTCSEPHDAFNFMHIVSMASAADSKCGVAEIEATEVVPSHCFQYHSVNNFKKLEASSVLDSNSLAGLGNDLAPAYMWVASASVGHPTLRHHEFKHKRHLKLSSTNMAYLTETSGRRSIFGFNLVETPGKLGCWLACPARSLLSPSPYTSWPTLNSPKEELTLRITNLRKFYQL